MGLSGRIGVGGNHPGPISFYLLAPFYRLMGSDAGALYASTLLLNFVWIVVALVLARRRGADHLMVAVGVLYLVLIAGLGFTLIDQPWNPYLPLMAWPVVLLAAWLVATGDLVAIPILVFAATFCAQTHISYVLPCGCVVAFAILVLGVQRVYLARRSSRQDLAGDGRVHWLVDPDLAKTSIGRISAWIGGSVLLGLVLWLPPIYDQIQRGDHGNFSTIASAMLHPATPPLGLSDGLRLAFHHLDLTHLFDRNVITLDPLGWSWFGVILLCVWLASCVMAVRMRARLIVIGDAVIAVALATGVVAASRIFGITYSYLTLWFWALLLGMVLTIGCTCWEAITRADVAPRFERLDGSDRWLVVACVVLPIYVVVLVGAVTTNIPDRQESDQLARVLPATVAAIASGRVFPAGGSGPVLVTWDDPINAGGEGYGMVDALRSKGITAGMPPILAMATPHGLSIAPGTERGNVHLSIGSDAINAWREKPGAIEVAYFDGRSRHDLAEQRRLHIEIRALLRDAGEDPNLLDHSMLAAFAHPLPSSITERLKRSAEIGLPVAVFLTPPA